MLVELKEPSVGTRPVAQLAIRQAKPIPAEQLALNRQLGRSVGAKTPAAVAAEGELLTEQLPSRVYEVGSDGGSYGTYVDLSKGDAELCEKLAQLKAKAKDAVIGANGIRVLCGADRTKLPNDKLKAVCIRLLALTQTQVKEFFIDITLPGKPDYYLARHVEVLTVDLIGTWSSLYPSQFEERYDYLEAVNTVVKTYQYQVKCNGRENVTISGNGIKWDELQGDRIIAIGGTGIRRGQKDRNQLLNLVPLLCKVTYLVDTDFSFRTDQHGRVDLITANLRQRPNRRDGGLQAEAKRVKHGRETDSGTDDDECTGTEFDANGNVVDCREVIETKKDDGGHMIGAQFNGPVEQINYFPQQFFSNQNGTWKKMEDEWARVRFQQRVPFTIGTTQRFTGPTDVYVEITPNFPSGNCKPNEPCRRPESFEVRYFYGGVQQTRANNPNYQIDPILNP